MLIYNESVDFEFREKGHLYTVRHKVGEMWTIPQEVEGTTTILRIINKPFLMTYPMNKALEYLRGLETITEKDWVNAKRAHIEYSNAGKKAGKVGHALVEALAQDKEVVMPKEEEERAQAESIEKAYRAFCEDFEPVTLEVEAPFYSRTHNYAGTVDLICEIDGKKVLLDWKTTNPSYYNPDGIYVENFAQLGAYSLGYSEMTGMDIDDLMIVNLPKDGSEYKIKRLSDMGLSREEAELYFLHALMLHRSHKNFTWKFGGN